MLLSLRVEVGRTLQLMQLLPVYCQVFWHLMGHLRFESPNDNETCHHFWRWWIILRQKTEK